MGRPPKKAEDRRREATLRLDPKVRYKLQEEAKKSGRSFSADLEARIVATCDLDREGVDLVHAIAREIDQIQKLTRKRWHKDLKTWASVAEMLRIGPIHDFNPDRPQDDELIAEAFEKHLGLQFTRSSLIDELADLGIAARRDPDLGAGSEPGLIGLPDRTRSAARRMCEKLDDVEDRKRALDRLEALLQIDEQVRQAAAVLQEALRPNAEAHVAGRFLYRDYLRKEVERKRSLNESFNIIHLVELGP